jgi:predicted nuclease of predicted toxin-antitoxin system
MKLLLDENLSPRLSIMLADLYPGTLHVRDCGLEQVSDQKVWEYAGSNGFVIVSKDSDFEQQSLLRGHPPKVIWVRLGNCSTRDIEGVLRRFSPVIHTFNLDPIETILVLP